MVYMKKETSLNLSKSEIGTGNILAVAANIVARFLTGCAALETHLQDARYRLEAVQVIVAGD